MGCEIVEEEFDFGVVNVYEDMVGDGRRV